MNRLLLAGAVLRDLALIAIGLDAYYGHPLAGLWFLERAQAVGADTLRGVTSFLVLGSTPAAAALLLTDSVLRPQRLRLITGAFVTVVGAGFLLTLLVYMLRAPHVLDWSKEAVAALVHLSIMAHGIWLLTTVRPPVARLTAALVPCVLWIALVTVPNHPWLVVWQHTWYDWTTGNLPFR